MSKIDREVIEEVIRDLQKKHDFHFKGFQMRDIGFTGHMMAFNAYNYAIKRLKMALNQYCGESIDEEA